MRKLDYDKLTKWHQFIQRCVDVSIPIGCAFAQVFVVFKFAVVPASIVTAFGSVDAGYWWSLLSFIAYTAIVIGVLLRPNKEDIINKRGIRQRLGDTYVYFEYPGLVAASTFTLIYSAALALAFGVLSVSVVAIGFGLALSTYFLFRTLRFALELRMSGIFTGGKQEVTEG